MRSAPTILLTLAALLAAACAPEKPVGPQPYLGPTESMAAVVAAINANNQPIATLWATHDFEAWIVDENHDEHFVNGRGVLLYQKPFGLLLQGKKDLGKVFEIGSNRDRYWLTLLMGPETMWWGDYANLAKPRARHAIPIRPDAFMEILGVGDIDTDFRREPAPVMRFNNDADAYMFVWSFPGPDRRIAQKEIWYDRASKRPTLILLFDPDGRIILRAYLSDPRPIITDGVPDDQRPVIAGTYRLYFPENGSKMTLRLSEVRASKRGIPNDRTFAFPTNPEVSHIIQIDEGCDD